MTEWFRPVGRFWWGSFITPNEGHRSSRDKWLCHLTVEKKRPSKQIHPWLSSHLTHSLINTASSFNQYLLCWLIVAKKSLQGTGKKEKKRKNNGHVRQRDPVEAYSLWSRGCMSQLKMNYGDLTQVTYWLHTLFHTEVHFKLWQDTKFPLKWLKSIFKTHCVL